MESLSPEQLQDTVENLFFSINTNREIVLSFRFNEKTPIAFVDINNLRVALREVFANAIESIVGAGSILVSIIYDNAANEFVLKVANNGRPLSLTMQTKLFIPFTGDKQGKKSIGLVRAKLACQRLGGDVSFESSNEDQTVFLIRFPAFMKTKSLP